MLPKSVTPFFLSLFKNINNMQIQLKKKSSFVTLRNSVLFVVSWLTSGLFIQECNL